jgi:hypothetical protein
MPQVIAIDQPNTATKPATSFLGLIPGILLLAAVGYAGKFIEQFIARYGKSHHLVLPNIEYVLWAILIGLLIANTVGVPESSVAASPPTSSGSRPASSCSAPASSSATSPSSAASPSSSSSSRSVSASLHDLASAAPSNSSPSSSRCSPSAPPSAASPPSSPAGRHRSRRGRLLLRHRRHPRPRRHLPLRLPAHRPRAPPQRPRLRRLDRPRRRQHRRSHRRRSPLLRRRRQSRRPRQNLPQRHDRLRRPRLRYLLGPQRSGRRNPEQGRLPLDQVPQVRPRLPPHLALASVGFFSKPGLLAIGNLSRWAFLLTFAGVGLTHQLPRTLQTRRPPLPRRSHRRSRHRRHHPRQKCLVGPFLTVAFKLFILLHQLHHNAMNG